jgi:hypothetical protein
MALTYQLGKRDPQPNPKPKKLVSGIVVNRKEQQQQQSLQTWDSLIYDIWMAKVRARPDLYQDAKISHGYNCKCCSRAFKEG